MSRGNRLNMFSGLWEVKERQMIFLGFLIIFNELMRNQNFPAFPSKIFSLSGLWEGKERQIMFLSFLIIFNDLMRNHNFPALHGNAHRSCKYMFQS